jgi:small redox-active disulfide protein 2
MDIKVLGPGCSRCLELEKRVRRAVDELNAQATVEKISDIMKMLEYRIMATPGLVIDGKVKVSGRVASIEEIKGWIQEATGVSKADS